MDEDTRAAAVVDCCDEPTVRGLVEELEIDVRIEQVLCTHKHWDHAWGNARMRAAGAEILGGVHEEVPAKTRSVADGDSVSVGGLTVKCTRGRGLLCM